MRLALFLALALTSGAPGAGLEELDLEARELHWSFQPVTDPEPPEVEHERWPRDPLDRFVLERLEHAGLAPAAPAGRATWIRRVSFDLTGLPPAPDEVQAFLADETGGAFERVVDRLLASPHFGERWARHWLDLVGYAETRGHEFDHVLPGAWQYRDYLIRAFNADVPYDRLVSEHLAGDLLAEPRPHPVEGFDESILGTGFWWLGEEVHSPVSTRADECDRLAGRVDVVGRAFLGLTVACARCHDHKFDPITAADFHALVGFQKSAAYRQVRFETMEHNARVAGALAELRAERRRALMGASAERLAAEVAGMEEMLLAARDVLARQSPGERADGAVPEAAVASVAHERVLAPALVAGWAREMLAACARPRDPLHAFATAGCGLAGPEQTDGEEGRVALEETDVVLDFRGRAPRPLMQNGFAFGSGSTALGDVLWGESASWPIARVHATGAARADPLWKVLEPAPGTERDPGAVDWLQAGRTLRTPTFPLTKGRLFYWVRGACDAYAAIDHHRLVDGPLHARAVRRWDSGDGGFRWIEHDLADYVGHQVHVELTPSGDWADFALALVVQADAEPAPLAALNALLRAAVAESAGSIADARSLARAYRAAFARAVRHFALGFDGLDERGAAACAELVDWWVRRPHLARYAAEPTGAAASAFERLAELRAEIRAVSHTAPAMWEGNGVDELRLARGDPEMPGEPVPRRFLEALAGSEQPPIERGSGRLELARRLTDPASPLFARVLANRLWQHMFGRGIVPTVDDFGHMGEPPSHPELLDHLARRFERGGCSIKGMLRAIALSATYRMSSASDPRAALLDPDGALLHRFPVRRLTAEAIRDGILAVSGELDRTLYGKPVPVHLTAFMDGRGKPESGPLDGARRRSIYLAVRRNFLSPFFLAFDYPPPATTMGQRSTSNVPAQALALMNDPFVAQQAQRWARRALAAEMDDAERVGVLYLAAFARPPTSVELADSRAFLEDQAARYPEPEARERAWGDLCHVLFNTKEFVFSN